jgi:hypothetical protein
MPTRWCDRRCRCDRARVFSSEVDTGSRQENTSNQ